MQKQVILVGSQYGAVALKIDRKGVNMNSIIWKYVKPLKDRQYIKKFEVENGITIPQDLKECIFNNNGGRPSVKVYDTSKSSGRVIKTLLSYNEEDIEKIYKILPLFKENSMCLLPFASDPSGNFICVDLENKDSIVLWLHETNTTEYIAETFSKFLGILHN